MSISSATSSQPVSTTASSSTINTGKTVSVSKQQNNQQSGQSQQSVQQQQSQQQQQQQLHTLGQVLVVNHVYDIGSYELTQVVNYKMKYKLPLYIGSLTTVWSSDV